MRGRLCVNFNEHSNLVGKHAFLSASKYHWINYNLDKLVVVYTRAMAVEKGLALHAFAQQCILLGQKLPSSNKALNMYVNDAIGFRMRPEQILYYSPNAFGTADAISFRGNVLRIHDLKTGISRVSMSQLEVYAALFCLEYEFKPDKIDMELRIYQGFNIIVHIPEANRIQGIMDKIVIFDKKIEEIIAIMEA